MRTSSINSMSIKVEANSDRSMITTTSMSSITLNPTLRKPQVVIVETILVVDLVIWLNIASPPPMRMITSRTTPVIGMTVVAVLRVVRMVAESDEKCMVVIDGPDR